MASSMSCVTKINVFPNCCCNFFTKSCNVSLVIGSKAPNGSSIKIISCSAASARITPIRCCCPPDNCEGYRSKYSSGKSTSLISSFAFLSFFSCDHFNNLGTSTIFSLIVI